MKEWSQLGSIDVPYKSEQYEVVVEGKFSESMENQDADGNRGRLITFCDEIEIITISPPPPSAESLREIEEFIFTLNSDDFFWSNEGPEEPDHEDVDLPGDVPWDLYIPDDNDLIENPFKWVDAPDNA